jgi:hypothetical protein
MKSYDMISFLISTRLQPSVGTGAMTSRFNGLSPRGKPLRRFLRGSPIHTGLKPGANESRSARKPNIP